MPIKTVEQRLIETFRQARWPKTEGQPACPVCNGADEVKPAVKFQSRRPTDWPRWHWCTCCQKTFSDWSGTPMRASKAPLWYWAQAVLIGPLPTFNKDAGRTTGVPYDSLKILRGRLEDWSLLDRWKAELEKTGLTLERIRLAFAPNGHSFNAPGQGYKVKRRRSS